MKKIIGGLIPLTKLIARSVLNLKFLIFLLLLTRTCFPAGAAVTDQQQVVTGKVTDSQTGEPMPGVNIVVKGSTVGAMTDSQGKYTVSVPGKDAILVFSFIGYASREVPSGGRATLDIALVSEALSLEEVVVVGYGTQRKVSLTGSIAAVKSEELTRSPVINVSNSMSGLLPGVIALNRSGEPGNTSTILIRGRSTTGNTNPLVVVDGIQDYSGWQRINPEDIESISVLKDASAAIYGARAANGVILITTKRGTSGKPTINYSFSEGISQLTRIPEMADAVLYCEFVNSRQAMYGQAPMYSAEDIQKYKDGTDPFYANTDWYASCLKKYTLQNHHNLNITGGTDKMKYMVSGSYSNEDGIFKSGSTYFKTYSVLGRIDAQVNEYVKVAADLNTSYDDGYNTGSPFGSLGQILPIDPVIWPNGVHSAGIASGANPDIEASEESGYSRNRIQRIITKGSFDISIPWIKGLGVDGYVTYSSTNNIGKSWQKVWITNSYNRKTGVYSVVKGGPTTPRLTESLNYGRNILINLRAKYEKQFGQHNLSTFIAVEQSEGNSNNFSGYREGYLSQALDQLFAGSLTGMTATGSASESGRKNIFGRLSYGFRDRYLVDFNFRYDGSSNFPKDKRWGFFPGGSAAWRISEESFIKDNVTFINNLKLRASYGQIGNDQVSAFQWLSTYSLGSTGYTFGMTPVTQQGLTAGVTPNGNITWEVAEISNLGLDGTFWNGLLGFTVDVFKQRRSNILAVRDLAVPYFTGLTLPNENIGIVENKGIEVELTHARSIGEVHYRLGGNIAYARNNVVDVSEPINVPEWQKAEGHVLGAERYYTALGIIRTEEELASVPVIAGSKVGDLKYKDIDNDNKITDADMVRMDKTNTPEITFGFNLSATYKNFSLWTHFSGQTRAWQYFHKYSKEGGHNSLKELLENRYTPGSMTSKYPIIPSSETQGMDVSGYPSTFWLMDASFLRLKTLELSYSLPSELLSKVNISSLRIFVNGNNLFTIDKLKWYDPEGSNNTGAFYPQNKIYNIGLKVSF